MTRTIEFTDAPANALELLQSGIPGVDVAWEGNKGSFRLPMLAAVSGTVEVAGTNIVIELELGGMDGAWPMIENGIRAKVHTALGWG